jgi:hypothetical protein
MRRVQAAFRLAFAIIAVAALGLGQPLPSAQAASVARRPQHVFLIVLENKDFTTSFGEGAKGEYLDDLTKRGELLTHYYGIGHNSLDNYIAMISGESPTSDTQEDCKQYKEFRPTAGTLDADGQVHGAGCVYPSTVLTIANQLTKSGLTWRGYMEDMKKPWEHPAVDAEDENTKARGPGDQYATKHNPFVYFHAIIDDPAFCDGHDVPLQRLHQDLREAASTPNLAFITPNLCNDGHDDTRPTCPDGYPKSTERFLHQWVPEILASPAYQQDGMLIITFDESEVRYKEDHTVDGSRTDATSCCGEPSGPNVQHPGLVGAGGGRIGAIILSQFVKAGSTNDTPCNHYSLLRSVEDLFGLEHLGYAKQSGLKAFGDDVYNNTAQ